MFGCIGIPPACGAVYNSRRWITYNITAAIAGNIDDVVWTKWAHYHVATPFGIGVSKGYLFEFFLFLGWLCKI